MTPISICTIIKNEEKHILNFLNAIEKHLGDYPHEIVIADTGSTDRSTALVKEFDRNKASIKLLHFDWINDFAAAKNFSVNSAQNDYVLFLDADEYISELERSCFDLFIKQNKSALGLIKRINHTNAGGFENTTNELIPRFYNRTLFRYDGIIHEQLIPSASRIELPITIDHYGYTGTPEEIKGKAERNNALLFKMLEKNPDDPYIFYQFGQSYSAIHDYENAYKYYGKALEFDVDPRLDYIIQTVVGYGYAMLETNRLSEALNLEGIYDEFKQSADFLFLMGLVYLRNGMIDNAYSEFENAVKPPRNGEKARLSCEVAGSDSYLAYYNMAIIDEAKGNIQKAKELYKKCGDFAPALKRLKSL